MKRALLAPFLFGAWLALAEAPALADAGPSCGSKNHGETPPPRDGSLGYRTRRAAGGGLVLVGGMASIWAATRRRG